MDLRVFGQEDGAAVFERQDRSFESADFLRVFDDPFLIHRHQRTQHRHIDHRIDGIHAFQRLAGYLTDAFAGIDSHGAALLGDAFGDAEHHAAHDGDAVFFAAIGIDGALDLGEVDHVQADRRAVPLSQHFA